MKFNDNNCEGCALKTPFYYCQVLILDPVVSNRWQVFHHMAVFVNVILIIQYISFTYYCVHVRKENYAEYVVLFTFQVYYTNAQVYHCNMYKYF